MEPIQERARTVLMLTFDEASHLKREAMWGVAVAAMASLYSYGTLRGRLTQTERYVRRPVVEKKRDIGLPSQLLKLQAGLYLPAYAAVMDRIPANFGWSQRVAPRRRAGPPPQ